MNLDSPLPSNVITFQIPAGLSITAAAEGIYEGFISTASSVGTPGGAIHPSNGALSGYLVMIFAMLNFSGIEAFIIDLAGAPTNTAWNISFTDSNNVVWNFNSTQANPTTGIGQTQWSIPLTGAVPYLIPGVTYPITVH